MSKEEISMRIFGLKLDLNNYKEDVEQVELFGMQRTDYEQKKEKCKNIILELRQLEAQINDINKGIENGEKGND